MGVPTEERKEERRSSTTARCIGESEKAQWSKGAAPKGSGNVHGRMDDEEGGGNLCGMQGM